MYAEERQREIVESARAAGRVEVGTLAEVLGVTPETVRRDLTRLERQGMLRRTHGGAVPVESLLPEREVSERLGAMVEEKGRISKAALDYLPRQGTVMLDAGTTTGAFAALLPTDRELTVVTNSVPVAGVLAANPGVTLYLTGGRVRGRTLASVGEPATSFLRRLTLDVVFVAANGVSPEKGLTTPDMAEATVKRVMVERARRVVLLADSTKFGEEHFVRFAELSQVDVIVTDRGLTEDEAAVYREAGPEVVRA
ncbi:Transcriptional regulators of sugar metabolism [Rubrobacter radiotolerans]|uniref:Lactose phosphotransferase system repressor n=1 Tax=Rubrobacter radiotolerans TaxID=42256 RepID=A0A023X4F5_RUBRA|nr:DeoR/GlpR family DNA-binding transcription regulator [Rubrobacter radiotolerans]AHY46939.1 Transcriptional regulators of sugar metabolism [Rubrobacter radiotolerans]MDX5894344.1 DeoR/GlpR family DNA-binding transcription regulator [Rubrobacter radiotolerans]SMC05791.1 transcriptional regulator, DeoR family [Rubrobacter radiotolerans DSM 5868]